VPHALRSKAWDSMTCPSHSFARRVPHPSRFLRRVGFNDLSFSFFRALRLRLSAGPFDSSSLRLGLAQGRLYGSKELIPLFVLTRR
jgi:hypothetical protein